MPLPDTQAPAVPMIDKAGPIRRFNDSAIQGAIDRAVEALPDGAHGAVVAFADGDLARLAVVGKFGEHWTVVTAVEKPWDGKLEAEASVRFVW